MTPTVTAFVARGCGACHMYVPVLRRVGGPYARHVRLLVVEISSGAGARAASIERIRATPTTIVRSRSGKTYRRVGALPPEQIDQLFQSAMR